jgi:hypothetical protein
MANARTLLCDVFKLRILNIFNDIAAIFAPNLLGEQQ